VRRLFLFLSATGFLAFAACGNKAQEEAAALTGGDPNHGKDLIRQYGCSTCHTIPGVPGADAQVGPSLDKLARRVYIAGKLDNSPPNLAAWIRDPRGIDPKTAMPNLGVTADDARDIETYLYTLK
jgi:cytochrome c